MIGRLYGIWIGAESQSASDTTLLEFTSAADSVTLIERLSLTNVDTNTSENCAVKVQRVTTTGTYTSAPVPVPFQAGDAAFGGATKQDATIEPTYTASKVLLEQGFNILSGFLWTPASDDEVMVISPSALLGFALDVAGSGAIVWSYGATIREIGG